MVFLMSDAISASSDSSFTTIPVLVVQPDNIFPWAKKYVWTVAWQ